MKEIAREGCARRECDAGYALGTCAALSRAEILPYGLPMRTLLVSVFACCLALVPAARAASFSNPAAISLNEPAALCHRRQVRPTLPRLRCREFPAPFRRWSCA